MLRTVFLCNELKFLSCWTQNQLRVLYLGCLTNPYTGVEVDPSFFGFERFLLLASSDWAMLPTVGTRGLWLRRAWKVAVTAAWREENLNVKKERRAYKLPSTDASLVLKDLLSAGSLKSSKSEPGSG